MFRLCYIIYDLYSNLNFFIIIHKHIIIYKYIMCDIVEYNYNKIYNKNYYNEINANDELRYLTFVIRDITSSKAYNIYIKKQHDKFFYFFEYDDIYINVSRDDNKMHDFGEPIIIKENIMVKYNIPKFMEGLYYRVDHGTFGLDNDTIIGNKNKNEWNYICPFYTEDNNNGLDMYYHGEDELHLYVKVIDDKYYYKISDNPKLCKYTPIERYTFFNKEDYSKLNFYEPIIFGKQYFYRYFYFKKKNNKIKINGKMGITQPKNDNEKNAGLDKSKWNIINYIETEEDKWEYISLINEDGYGIYYFLLKHRYLNSKNYYRYICENDEGEKHECSSTHTSIDISKKDFSEYYDGEEIIINNKKLRINKFFK
jgi:hypothetical protein